MSGIVVELGTKASCAPGPVPAVVERLRDLLAKAERGEVTGLAAAYVDGGNAAWHCVSPGRASSNTLTAAVFDLSFSVGRNRNENEI